MIRRITNEANQKLIVWGLLIGILFLSSLYIFFVHRTVFLVVERKVATEKFASLNTELTNLQSEHLSLSNQITAELAYSLGFKEATPTFITRQSLSVNTIARTGGLQ